MRACVSLMAFWNNSECLNRFSMVHFHTFISKLFYLTLTYLNLEVYLRPHKEILIIVAVTLQSLPTINSIHKGKYRAS